MLSGGPLSRKNKLHENGRKIVKDSLVLCFYSNNCGNYGIFVVVMVSELSVTWVIAAHIQRKENGAETKSSRILSPLSAAKFSPLPFKMHTMTVILR